MCGCGCGCVCALVYVARILWKTSGKGAKKGREARMGPGYVPLRPMLLRPIATEANCHLGQKHFSTGRRNDKFCSHDLSSTGPPFPLPSQDTPPLDLPPARPPKISLHFSSRAANFIISSLSLSWRVFSWNCCGHESQPLTTQGAVGLITK